MLNRSLRARARSRRVAGCSAHRARSPPGRSGSAAGRTSCACTQQAASRRSRAAFSGVIASSGLPKRRLLPRLHLADHQGVAVPGHDVDLADVAPPVAVEHDRVPVRSGERPASSSPEPTPHVLGTHVSITSGQVTVLRRPATPSPRTRTGCGEVGRSSALWTGGQARGQRPWVELRRNDLLDVDVLEGQHPHLAHESRRPVEVPHPGVLQVHLDVGVRSRRPDAPGRRRSSPGRTGGRSRRRTGTARRRRGTRGRARARARLRTVSRSSALTGPPLALSRSPRQTPGAPVVVARAVHAAALPDARRTRSPCSRPSRSAGARRQVGHHRVPGRLGEDAGRGHRGTRQVGLDLRDDGGT